MRGVAHTTLGGVPRRTRPRGYKQRKFRYYKIVLPTTESGVSQLLTSNKFVSIAPNSYATQVRRVALMDAFTGRDLLVDDNIDMFFQFGSEFDRNRTIDLIKSGELGIGSPITSDIRRPSILIDLKKSACVSSFSLCMMYLNSGIQLYGSHKGTVWELISNSSLETLQKQYDPNMGWGVRWFNIDVVTGSYPVLDKDAEYTYWGIFFGLDYNSQLGWLEMYEIEFRDGVGGTNLCTGGSANAWCNSKLDDGGVVGDYSSNLFDGNGGTSAGSNNGDSVAYRFQNPVKPVTVAITAEGSSSSTPIEFSVIYSSDKVIWNEYKYFSTPQGTWPGSGSSTQEFEL